MTEYETVIGLECHAQLLTATKLFCGCVAPASARRRTRIFIRSASGFPALYPFSTAAR